VRPCTSMAKSVMSHLQLRGSSPSDLDDVEPAEGEGVVERGERFLPGRTWDEAVHAPVVPRTTASSSSESQ